MLRKSVKHACLKMELILHIWESQATRHPNIKVSWFE